MKIKISDLRELGCVTFLEVRERRDGDVQDGAVRPRESVVGTEQLDDCPDTLRTT